MRKYRLKISGEEVKANAEKTPHGSKIGKRVAPFRDDRPTDISR
jgi:hypothetical protein